MSGVRGIRTLADLRDRCVIDELTGCWLWRGAMSAGVPRSWSAVEGRTVTTRRLAWQLGTGSAPPDGMTVYSPRCCDARCVNPKHLLLGTKAEAGAAFQASGHLRGDPMRSLRNLRNGMRTSIATPELRALILSSDEPATRLGPKLGLSNATVSYVRQGKRWANIDGFSVFSAWRKAP